jgi:hypothetical protein
MQRRGQKVSITGMDEWLCGVVEGKRTSGKTLHRTTVAADANRVLPNPNQFYQHRRRPVHCYRIEWHPLRAREPCLQVPGIHCSRLFLVRASPVRSHVPTAGCGVSSQ